VNKKKISGLYTSFQKKQIGYYLSAYFGVDVFSLMQENLKFPTLYKKENLLNYIISIRIVPKKRNPRGKLSTNHSTPNLEFITEDQLITPSVLPLTSIEQNYVYFTFSQHFKFSEARKYEFQMTILDLSIGRASKLKKLALRILSTRYSPDNIPDLVDLCAKLQGITGYQKEIYDRMQKNNYLITNKAYNLIKNEIMKDVSYIDQRTNTSTRDYGSGANSTAVSKWSVPIRHIRNEFGAVVKPVIKQNLSNNTVVFNNVTTTPLNQVLYTSRVEMLTTVVNSLPTIEDKFEKFHRYEDISSLKEKAENLNLDFVCLDVASDDGSIKTAFVESQDVADVYALVNHSYNSVSSPNFVLLSEISDTLNNSTYLCKTYYEDGENQYFLLSPTLTSQFIKPLGT